MEWGHSGLWGVIGRRPTVSETDLSGGEVVYGDTGLCPSPPLLPSDYWNNEPQRLKISLEHSCWGEVKGRCLHANEGRNKCISKAEISHCFDSQWNNLIGQKRPWDNGGSVMGHTLAVVTKLDIPMALYLNPVSVPQRHSGHWIPFFAPLPHMATLNKPFPPFTVASKLAYWDQWPCPPCWSCWNTGFHPKSSSSAPRSASRSFVWTSFLHWPQSSLWPWMYQWGEMGALAESHLAVDFKQPCPKRIKTHSSGQKWERQQFRIWWPQSPGFTLLWFLG